MSSRVTRITIRAKLTAAFAVVILMSVLSTWLSISGLANLSENITNLVDGSARRDKLTVEMQRTIFQLQREEKTFLLVSDPAEIEAIEQQVLAHHQTFREQVKSLYELAVADEERARIANIETLFAELVTVQNKVRDIGRTRSKTQSYAILKTEMKQVMSQAITTLRKLTAETSKPTPAQLRASDQIWRMVAIWANANNALREAIITMTDEETEAAVEMVPAILERIHGMQAQIPALLNTQEKEVYQQFLVQYRTWEAACQRLAVEVRRNTEVKAIALSQGEVRVVAAKLNAALDEISTSASQSMESDKTEAEARYADTRWVLVATAAISLLISLISAWLIANSISGHVGQAVVLANTVAQGDLNVSYQKPPSNDEMGDLSAALMSMVKNLRSSVEVAEAIARGDLGVDAQPHSDRDMLGTALQMMVMQLQQVMAQANQAAHTVATSSHQLTSSAEQLSQGASEQAAATEQASAAMEEMASVIKQTADNACRTESIARESSNAAMESGVAVKQTLEAMQMIANRISIIQDISRQTDMLALNAAVEAARAGQYGKGFSVVAAEVRKLAERSERAAAEISTMSTNTMEVALKAGEMLDKLVPNILKTSELISEISAACREQDIGADQVNSAIQQLDKVTQRNASSAEEMSSTSETLAVQATELQELIGFFRSEQRDPL